MMVLMFLGCWELGETYLSGYDLLVCDKGSLF